MSPLATVFSVTAPLNGMLVERFKYRHVGMLVAPVAIIFALALTGPSPLLPLNKYAIWPSGEPFH